MKQFATAWLATVTLAAAPAGARSPEVPITHRNPDAVDVATTPMNDLNLRKEEIPQLLIDAQERPYDLIGIDRCSSIASAVGELDAVLGDDLDLPQSSRRRISATRVAQSVVGSFIPFRGIIREVSGANNQQRMIQAAIEAGLARRGFLKGVGQAKGCRYPARAATAKVIAQYNRKASASLAASDEPATGLASPPQQ